MKQILTYITFFLLVIFFANSQSIKPDQKVAEAKASGASFGEVSLFQEVSQKARVSVSEEFENYNLLSFRPEAMRSFNSSTPETMNFSLPGLDQSELSLELVKVDFRADDFTITEMPSGRKITPSNELAHYRGVVKGVQGSLVAISISEEEVSGVITINGTSGNLVLGKLADSKQHILYADSDISHLNKFFCHAPDNVAGQGRVAETDQVENIAKCPEIFFDIGSDIVSDKGGAQAASNYIEAVFNQVAILYDNIEVTIKISGVQAWTSTTPFSNLGNFRSYRNQNGFNGDLAHFVTYNYSGGVAYLNGLCGSSSYALSGIQSNFSNVPQYSWTVMVVAHELGHNLGSPHTQACRWNGNNTAIDGCYNVEGGCGRPGIPSDGGTIMSYCHLTSVGINFQKGFHPQVANRIRNTITGKSCVATCNSDGGGGDDDGPCDGVAEYNPNINYDPGDLVTYQGTLYRRNDADSGWINLGPCEGNDDPCFGVPDWSPTGNYSVGDRVIYQGILYELTSSGWQSITSCTAAVASLLGDESALTANKFEVYPNPAEDVINIKTSDLAHSVSEILVTDINGKILRAVEISPEKFPNSQSIEQSIQINGLKSGIYFIQVIMDQEKLTQKFYVK